MTEEYAAKIVHECDEIQKRSSLERSLKLSISTSTSTASCSMVGDVESSMPVMKIRNRQLDRDLLAMELMRAEEFEVQDLQGRISGDVDWKLSRGEIGKCSVKSPRLPSMATATAINGSLRAKVSNEEEEEKEEEEEGADDDRCLALCFISLGGRVHEDTDAFDSTQCLWSLLELLDDAALGGSDAELKNKTSTSSSTSGSTSAPTSGSTSSCNNGHGEEEQHVSITAKHIDKMKDENNDNGLELKVEIKPSLADNEKKHDENNPDFKSNTLKYLSFPTSTVQEVIESSLVRISQLQDCEDQRFYRPQAKYHTHPNATPLQVTKRTALTPSLRALWESLKVSGITVFAGIVGSRGCSCGS